MRFPPGSAVALRVARGHRIGLKIESDDWNVSCRSESSAHRGRTNGKQYIDFRRTSSAAGSAKRVGSPALSRNSNTTFLPSTQPCSPAFVEGSYHAVFRAQNRAR